MKGTSARARPEQDRQAALRAYGLLPSQAPMVSAPHGGPAAARTALDNLVDLAAKLCHVPYSVVNVISGPAAPDRGVRRRTGHLLP
jgi:hypothetical protein